MKEKADILVLGTSGAGIKRKWCVKYMRKKLKLKPCVKVPFANKLYEGYEVLEGRAIIANVSVDKVKDMMADFIGMYDEPLFFFLELPGHLPMFFATTGSLRLDLAFLEVKKKLCLTI